MYRDVDETLRAQIADLKVQVATRQREAARLEERLREANQAADEAYFMVDGQRRHSFQHRWHTVEARKQREAKMGPLDFLMRTWGVAFKVAYVGMGLMFLRFLLGVLRSYM